MRNNPSRRELLTGFALVLGRALPLEAFPQSNLPKPQTEDPIADKIKQIIAEQLGVDSGKVVPSARFAEDLGADSLDQLELVMTLEEVFGLAIPCADRAKLPTVGSVISYVKKRNEVAFYQSNVPKPQSDEPIDDKVKHVIVQQLGVDSEEVVPSARFVEDLGADSLDQVQLVIAFDEAFDIEIPNEDCETLLTVGSVVSYIKKRKGVPFNEPSSAPSVQGKRALSNEALGPYPKDCKYTKEHEWIRARGNNALIGITNYAQESLGDIVFLELPKVGTHIERGKSFGTVESVKAVYELCAPVSGKVVSVNEFLRRRPEILNKGANRAWMMRVNLTDTKELDTLLSAEDYEAFVRKERAH